MAEEPCSPELVDHLVQFSLGITAVFDQAMGTQFAPNVEVRVVTALGLHGPWSGRALSEEVGASRRVVAGIIRSLESDGVVVSIAHPDDARAVQIALTRRGRTRIQRLSRNLAAFFVDAHPVVESILHTLPGRTTGSRPVPASPLAMLSSVASTGIRLEEAIGRRVGGTGLYGRQRLALLRLCAVDSARAGELADYLGLSSGGLTYVVDRLVQARLVERSYGPSGDRRVVLLRPTPAGRELTTQILTGFADGGPELRELFQQIASQGDAERSA